MLLHAPFYNGSIKKITAAFGTIFADFSIVREGNTNVVKTVSFTAGDTVLNLNATSNFITGALALVTGAGIAATTTVVSTTATTATLSLPVTSTQSKAKITFITTGLTTVKVPLSYSSKDKAFIRQSVDPSMNYNMGRVFPALAFQMTGMEYDSSRMISQTQYTAQMTSGAGATGSLMYTPVPYNIQFELYIGANNIEDGLQCIEQILPFFSPAYIITTKDWPTLNIIKDVPIVLNSVSYTDNTPDSGFEVDRIIEWTLSFTAKAYLYGPTQAAAPIKVVNNYLLSGTPTIQQGTVDVAVIPKTAAISDAYVITTTKTEVVG